MTTSRAQGSAAAGKGKIKPSVFGRYLLLDRVAAGGMAEVWRAKQFGAEDFQRIIAIKKILPHVVEDPEFIQMFKDEAKITVQLQHANIGQVYELNKVDETFYIAMEYISGKDAKTLWSYCRQKNDLIPVNLSAYIVQKMCEGLDYAHRKKDNFGVDLRIVHRDVSPQNVLISWEGEIKVIDFGIAKAAGKASKTQAGILKGKFGYMAPEQVRGMPLDQRADVFALGVVLYELVTGERAFVADSDFSLLEMVRNVEIKPPSLTNQNLPPEVERIIYKALAKDPDDRYEFGSDMAEDLQRFLLMQGKPPGRHDVAEYLRVNFPADYDRERLRMESYRDMEMPEPAAPPPQAAVPSASANATLDSASAAVMAAMADDTGSATFAGAATAQLNVPSSLQNQSGVHVSVPSDSRNSNTGIRPAATFVVPAEPEIDDNDLPEVSGGSTGKLIALAAAIVVGGLGIALLVGTLLKGTGIITVTTVPDGAEVFLDGESQGVANGGLTIKSVPSGQHSLKVQLDRYRPREVTVNLVRGKVEKQTLTLERTPEPTGIVTVRSKPGGAHVVLDGADINKTTPVDLEMDVGSHRVELRLDSYKNVELKLDVTKDDRLTKDVTLRPDRVAMEIRTLPPGADIFDSSRSKLGTSPWVYKDLSVEPPFPQLTFKRRGCKEYKTTLVADESGAASQSKTFTLNCRK